MNLAGGPEQRERLASLWEELDSWQERLGDAAPLRVAEPAPAFLDLKGTPRNPDPWQPRWIRRKYFDE
jgi:hypothetical protein